MISILQMVNQMVRYSIFGLDLHLEYLQNQISASWPTIAIATQALQGPSHKSEFLPPLTRGFKT